MSTLSARNSLLVIEIVLFMDWYKLHHSRYHLFVVVTPPNEIEIHPYSTDILYNTTSFILQRISIIKIEKGSSQRWLYTFAESNTILLNDTIIVPMMKTLDKLNNGGAILSSNHRIKWKKKIIELFDYKHQYINDWVNKSLLTATTKLKSAYQNCEHYFIVLAEKLNYLSVLDIASVVRLMPLVYLSRPTIFHITFNSQTLRLMYLFHQTTPNSLPPSNT